MDRNIVYVITIASVILGGCHREEAAAEAKIKEFHYDLTRTTGLDVETHDAAGPVAGVLVSVRASSPGAGLAGQLLWTGVTASDGHARANFRSERAGAADLDVVLHKPGLTGPYTDESLRSSAGPFAPSARLSVPIDQASPISVAMTAVSL